VIFLVFGAVAAVTYADGVEVNDNNKKLRDMMKAAGSDTSALDTKITDDENALQTKMWAMSGCIPVGTILAILGIFLILRWQRERSCPPAPPQA